MPKPCQVFFQGLKQFVGAILVVAGLVVCYNLIEIVPVMPPAPTPVKPTFTPSPPAAQIGIPTRIMAPTIDLDAPVVEMGWQAVEQGEEWVSEWDMPDDEAAWHRNSARPGEGGNVVISGHNDSTGGHVFARLDDLQVGHKITLWNDKKEAMTYYVVEKNIIRTIFNSAEAQTYLQAVMAPTAKDRLTLITCWPNWSNTHRLIVIAEP